MPETFLPDSPWPWLGIPLIIIVAAFAVALIWMTTKSAIKAMAEAAGNAMRRMEAPPPSIASPAHSPFVTEGLGSLRFDPDAMIVSLERRFLGEDARDAAEAAVDELVDLLKDKGVAPLYIADGEYDSNESGSEVVATLEVVVSGNEGPSSVAETALSAGFREDKSTPRQPLRLHRFQEMVGKLAIDIAVDNMRLLRSEFGIEKEFALLSAELSTITPGNEETETVIRARMLWQRA